MKALDLYAPKESAASAQPQCRYFGVCGGCSLQHLSYSDQLLMKQGQLRALFSGIDGMQGLALTGADQVWRYRNKAEFSFGTADGCVTLGFHAAKSFHRIVDLKDCLLMPSIAMDLLRQLCALAGQSGFSVYQQRSHQGFFRHVIIRISHSRQKIMVCLVTTTAGSREQAWVEAMSAALMRQNSALESVYWAKTDQLADAALPEQLDLISGKEWIEDSLGPFRIKLHPFSFIQSHSGQADLLYQAVASSLGENTQHQVAWDLYCGVGLVSLYLSRQFQTVYGIDSQPHHLHLAGQNAQDNGLRNIRWIAGKAEEVLKDRRFWLLEAKPDVVVVDPPRTGLHLSVISAILAARPLRIAYVSCNPETLLRDLKVFTGSFPEYRVTHAESFDMFPQTSHVETLVVLSR